MKGAFVRAAGELGDSPRPNASRIASLTGLTRRDVAALLQVAVYRPEGCLHHGVTSCSPRLKQVASCRVVPPQLPVMVQEDGRPQDIVGEGTAPGVRCDDEDVVRALMAIPVGALLPQLRHKRVDVYRA